MGEAFPGPIGARRRGAAGGAGAVLAAVGGGVARFRRRQHRKGRRCETASAGLRVVTGGARGGPGGIDVALSDWSPFGGGPRLHTAPSGHPGGASTRRVGAGGAAAEGIGVGGVPHGANALLPPASGTADGPHLPDAGDAKPRPRGRGHGPREQPGSAGGGGGRHGGGAGGGFGEGRAPPGGDVSSEGSTHRE